jgi:uncharacterized protein (DUF1330 family)
MAVYLVTEADWKGADPATIQAFSQAANPIVTRHGGKFLTAPRRPESLEGDWTPPVLMIIEFPDAEAVHRLWGAPEYQAAAALRREAGADFKIVVVEGV